MSDIKLYDESPNLYDTLQHLRPDYVNSIQVFIELVTKYLSNKKDLVLADFCCGTGKNTKIVSERASVSKAVLIDINKEFLEIAKNTITNVDLETYESDILNMSFVSNADVVISMFAYHHVRDEDKSKYIEKVKDVLKNGGLLFLGEIYVSNKEVIQKYYDGVLASAPINKYSLELKDFLMETAKSTSFEYKVSMGFAHDQFSQAGFNLLESRKIWPEDNSLGEDVGMYVEVWRLEF